MSAINTHVNAELLMIAQSKLSKKGINLNSVLNRFLYNIINDKLSDAEIQYLKSTSIIEGPRSEAMGLFADRIWISDDFDEELDDFNGFMYTNDELIAKGIDPNEFKKLYDE